MLEATDLDSEAAVLLSLIGEFVPVPGARLGAGSGRGGPGARRAGHAGRRPEELVADVLVLAEALTR